MALGTVCCSVSKRMMKKVSLVLESVLRLRKGLQKLKVGQDMILRLDTSV